MRLTNAQRTALHGKFGGRCAYCGEPLGARWHADHIEAVERKLEFVRDGHRTRLRTTGEVHRPERDCIENLNPACAPCNIDKHAMSLENWRQKLQNAPGVLSRNQPTYRHAVRFGLVQETGAAVTFFFERADGVPACPESGKHCNWIGGECHTCGITRGALDPKRHATKCKLYENNCGAVHPSNCPDCPFRTAGVRASDSEVARTPSSNTEGS